MKIFPSKEQWNRWTLPSKASYLALWIAIIGLLVMIPSCLINRQPKPNAEKINLVERYAYEFDNYLNSTTASGNNSRIIQQGAKLRKKYNPNTNVRLTLGIANENKGIPLAEARLQVLFKGDLSIQNFGRWVPQETNSRYSWKFSENINNTPLNADSIFVRFSQPGVYPITVSIDGTYLRRKEITYFLDLYEE